MLGTLAADVTGSREFCSWRTSFLNVALSVTEVKENSRR